MNARSKPTTASRMHSLRNEPPNFGNTIESHILLTSFFEVVVLERTPLFNFNYAESTFCKYILYLLKLKLKFLPVIYLCY